MRLRCRAFPLALSQHVSLCCVIVHFACQKGGCEAEGLRVCGHVSVCVCMWTCECVCVCVCCAVQSSPVQLLQAATDTDGAQRYHIPEALFREGEFEEIIDRHREDPSPPMHTHTHAHLLSTFTVSLCLSFFLSFYGATHTLANKLIVFPFFVF